MGQLHRRTGPFLFFFFFFFFFWGGGGAQNLLPEFRILARKSNVFGNAFFSHMGGGGGGRLGGGEY